MVGATTDQETDLRANELYWSSDRSVNQIAEELNLSKGVLYGLIQPRPAALACPACAAELVHSNRTALDRGLVDCPSCGWEGAEEEADPYEDDLPDVTEVRSPWTAVDRLRAACEGTWTRTAVGGALLGAAAGLGFVMWKRRR
jgi:predicted RNA-binding Zn-ribbon protein involved in translation (DUF1610 family)